MHECMTQTFDWRLVRNVLAVFEAGPLMDGACRLSGVLERLLQAGPGPHPLSISVHAHTASARIARRTCYGRFHPVTYPP
jgi:hypothetical protein